MLLQQLICRRRQGDSKEDSRNSKQACTEQHRGKDPDAGQAYRAADHAGIDDVAFQLLEDDEEQEKEERKAQTLAEDQNKTDRPSKVGAHQRNEGGHAYHRADGKCIWESEQQHAQGTQRSENHRFQKLAGEELGESRVSDRQDCHELAVVLLGDEAVGQIGELAHQPMLAEKQI